MNRNALFVRKRLEAAKEAGSGRPPPALTCSNVDYARLLEYVAGLDEKDLRDMCASMLAERDAAMNKFPQLSGMGAIRSATYADASPGMEQENIDMISHSPLVGSQFFDPESATCFSPDTKTEESMVASLRAYKKVVRAVCFDSREGTYHLNLDGMDYPGGWLQGYDTVNIPRTQRFDGTEQAKVVFPVKGDRRCQRIIMGLQLQPLFQGIERVIHDAYDTSKITVEEMHFLFGFSTHTHFSFHKDHQNVSNLRPQDTCLTCVAQLSPGESSMKVAGSRGERLYFLPGSVSIFDSETC